MHSPGEVSHPDPVDAAADRVVDAFIDSFVSPDPASVPIDRWLQRLIEALEFARMDLKKSLRVVDHGYYKDNLDRCVKRVEYVLAQLYEEQLHH